MTEVAKAAEESTSMVIENVINKMNEQRDCLVNMVSEYIEKYGIAEAMRKTRMPNRTLYRVMNEPEKVKLSTLTQIVKKLAA